MSKGLGIILLLAISPALVSAQNSNSSTNTSPRTQSPNTNRSVPPPKPSGTATTQKSAPPAPSPKTAQKTAPSPVPGSEAVVAAFNRLVDGIQTANVDKVMGVYWNSPSLSLFNYNGTVTKGWEQVRQNRLSSYPEIKNAKLDVRDLSVTMLGRDGALVNCLWTQSQTYKGTPETASGRMTLVFKRVGTTWKAIHLHTSTDSPNPASVPPSEQQPSPSASPKPSPTP